MRSPPRRCFPNLFRRIFAEGAFSQAFVPVYARAEREQGEGVPPSAASESLSVLLLSTLVLMIAAQIAMPWIMLVMHAGYADQPRYFNFAILLTQITMPYLVGMSASALFAGVLNTAGRFALVGGARRCSKSVHCSPPCCRAPIRRRRRNGARSHIAIAGVVQALLLWWGCARLGVSFWLPRAEADAGCAAHSVLDRARRVRGVGDADQCVRVAGVGLVRGGREVWLYAADRLYQLPLGFIGVAIGVALLPRLSRAVASDDGGDESGAIDEAWRLSMAFTLPAAAALLVMPFFLMHGFWTGGEFTDADARATADALFHYGWGVPAFVLPRILSPPFFARQDTSRPMRFALLPACWRTSCWARRSSSGCARWARPAMSASPSLHSAAAWVNVIRSPARCCAKRPGRRRRRRCRGWCASRSPPRSWRRAMAVAAHMREAIIAPFASALALGGKELAVLAVSAGGFLLFVVAAFALRAVTFAKFAAPSAARRARPWGRRLAAELGRLIEARR